MELSLSQAAKLTGKSKSTINRAVKSGRLSATKHEDGSYSIDPSELNRVFPATISRNPDWVDVQLVEEPNATLRFRLEIAERDIARERAEREREREDRRREQEQAEATIKDLRDRLDRAEGRITALLPSPQNPAPRRRWWRW